MGNDFLIEIRNANYELETWARNVGMEFNKLYNKCSQLETKIKILEEILKKEEE